MPGNRPPARERSARGEWQNKYKMLKSEFAAFKLKVANYQGAVHQLAVSASQASRRVGMLTQTVLACRKHFSAEPHFEDCAVRHPIDSVQLECDCGHAAILESIDKSLAEPDFDPDNVKIEIKDDTEAQGAVTTDPAPVSL